MPACVLHPPATAAPPPSPPPGNTIQTLVARPEVPEGRRSPLCILLPGGAGRIPEAAGVMDALGNPLAERGWLVVVPVSPDGTSFSGDAAEHVVSVMDKFGKEPDIRPGKVLLAGVSNGGIAALQVAGMVPDRVSGVIAVPGLLNHWTKVAQLRHLPVYLRIGAEDNLGWFEHYEDITRRLQHVGVRLDAELLEGVGHGIPLNWQEIDAWIARELGALGPSPRRVGKVILPAKAGQLRTWTSRNGASVEASLSEIRGEEVTLARKDGKLLKILQADLSAADRQFLDALVETHAQGSGRP